MTLDITHDSTLEEKPMAWLALERLIRSAGGTIGIEMKEDRTVVYWAIPFMT